MSPLSKKMKLGPGARATIIGAPEGYLSGLKPLPEGVILSSHLSGEFDWIQVFSRTKAGLEALMAEIPTALASQGFLWLSFPKGTSKIQTDLTRDRGWGILRDANLKFVTLISVNDTWSAFGLRHYKPGEPEQVFRLGD